MAIYGALERISVASSRVEMDLDPSPLWWSLHLLHVKIDEAGRVVAGGPPSCWQCSREVAEVRLGYVWLLEAQRWHDEGICRACGRTTIVPQGAGTTGVCTQCNLLGGLLERWKTVYDADSGAWKRYTAEEFHRATLKRCGLHIGDSHAETE